MRVSYLAALLLLLASPLADARRINANIQRHTVATEAPAPAPGGADDKAANIVSTIMFLVKKVGQATEAYNKFNNIKTAMDDTKEAVSLAEDAAKELTNRIPHAIQLMAKSGFQELLKKLNDGTVEVADFELIEKGDASSELNAAKMKEALEECEELAKEIKTILTTFDGVVALVDGTKELFDSANALAEGVIQEEQLSKIIDPVKTSVEKARAAVSNIYEQIDGGASKVLPMIESLVGGTADNRASEAMEKYEELKAKYPKLFEQMQQMLPELELLYDSVIKPLLPQLKKAVKAISDQAEKLWPRINRPDSVATETIARSSCSWKTTRRFANIEDVDVGNTMSCKSDKSWHGRYSCQCTGKYDCYAKVANRPEPTDLRRCFKPERK